MGGWVVEEEADGMSYCTLGLRRRVVGLNGGWFYYLIGD